MTSLRRSTPGLYAILDLPHASGLPVERIGLALTGQGGAASDQRAQVLQLRAKHASTAERVALLHRLAPVCLAAGTPLIVNDDIDAAVSFAQRDRTGVDFGLHLGHEDLAALVERHAPATARALLDELRARLNKPGGRSPLLGLSTHNEGQVERANHLPLDYIGVGPIFSTRSKTNADPCVGIEGLRRACRLSDHPVVAIGGLDGPRATQAIGAGASFVAMISALTGPDADTIKARALLAREHLSRAATLRDQA